jgi:hypothetical protein
MVLGTYRALDVKLCTNDRDLVIQRMHAPKNPVSAGVTGCVSPKKAPREYACALGTIQHVDGDLPMFFGWWTGFSAKKKCM